MARISLTENCRLECSSVARFRLITLSCTRTDSISVTERFPSRSDQLSVRRSDLVPSVEGFAAWQSHPLAFHRFPTGELLWGRAVLHTVGKITSCSVDLGHCVASGGPQLGCSHIVSHGWVSIHVDFSYYIGLVSCRGRPVYLLQTYMSVEDFRLCRQT